MITSNYFNYNQIATRMISATSFNNKKSLINLMNYSEVTKFNRVCARRQGYLT